MARTYYEVLGLKQDCTGEEIRSAFRKLALLRHPDHSKDPRAADLFIELTRAYDALSDPAKRRAYDQKLWPAAKRGSAQQGQRASKTAQTKDRPAVSVELDRLSRLFAHGRFSDAEMLARRIVAMDARQPVPYAVLGDIARGKGNLKEAQKMYAYAVQMDPDNLHYQTRYEELLQTVVVGSTSPGGAKSAIPALGVAFSVVALSGIYLACSTETALFPSLPLISSWTLGLVVMTFICGVVVGASLSIGEWLDRFNSNATATVGKVSPAVTLATIAVVSFWAATLLYLILGICQRGFNLSTSRLLATVAASVLALAGCAAISPSLSPYQVLLWSGNLMYLGSLSGWLVSDAFRRA